MGCLSRCWRIRWHWNHKKWSKNSEAKGTERTSWKISTRKSRTYCCQTGWERKKTAHSAENWTSRGQESKRGGTYDWREGILGRSWLGIPHCWTSSWQRRRSQKECRSQVARPLGGERNRKRWRRIRNRRWRRTNFWSNSKSSRDQRGVNLRTTATLRIRKYYNNQ